MDVNRLIVIGASAGGVEALLRLIPSLPADLAASICVVVHTSPRAKSLLPQLLARVGRMPARYPSDGETLIPSTIYVAPPDMHMTVEHDHLRISKGPRENMSRPAIDPLFRTAAQCFDGAVIGVILSGMLDDGTAGLGAIKDAGGTAIVQDPDETVFSGMPFSAMERVKVDYVLRVDEIGPKLIDLCANHKGRAEKVEVTPQERVSSYICPDCGGSLTEIRQGDIWYFKCRVGHAMSIETLLSGQTENIEKSLWSAVHALRERAEIAERLARRLRKRNPDSYSADRYESQAKKARADAQTIGDIIGKQEVLNESGEPTPPANED